MASIRERYEQAVEAYDKLMRGEAVRVFVDQNGERIEYAPANAAKLAAYISELKRSLDLASGKQQPRGPMRMWI